MKKGKIISIALLAALSACVSQDNKNAKNPTNSRHEMGYLYQDVAPEKYGDAWKRVWNLTGPNSADTAVDEITDKRGDNWREVARTDNKGIFIQKDTTKEVKYRFDGTLETPWMPALTDVIVTSAPANITEVTGWRCVIPKDTTVVTLNQRLFFKCHEIIVEGTLTAYPGGTYNGRGAGSVTLEADIINITGSINLSGERGSGGSNGRDGRYAREGMSINCTDGGNGGLGGNGGTLILTAKKKFTVLDKNKLIVEGGNGGWGGRRGGGYGNCHDGASGPKGSDGMLLINTPQNPEANL